MLWNPGQVHIYQNINYCILGRVIERVTGLSYADAVQQQVLGPAGITNMHIAGDTLAERRPDEVTYTAQAWDPYALPVARMDAHGGWIASTIDLLRFLTAVDGYPHRPQLLSAATKATMLTPSTAQQGGGYAKAWSVNTAAGTWFHNGDIAGTSTIMVRGTDGFAWALLANSRNDETQADLDLNRRDLDLLGWDLLSEVPDWPSTDLF
jgi:CubicO group peptidase (beta-lactamase class C family)